MESNSVSLRNLCIFMFYYIFHRNLAVSFSSIIFFFLRAMWPFPVLSQSPSPWRSPTPAASCSCRGWRTGRRGSSRWHCSSALGTRAGFSWPSTSHCRKAWSGCTSVTPDCAYRLAGLARPSWSSAQVSPLQLLELILWVLSCEFRLILSKCWWQKNIFTIQSWLICLRCNIGKNSNIFSQYLCLQPLSKVLRIERKSSRCIAIACCNVQFLNCVMSQRAMTHFWCLPQVRGRRVVFLLSWNYTRLQHWTLGWKDINLKIGTYPLRLSRKLLQRGAHPRAPLLCATFWILLPASRLLLWAEKSFSSNIKSNALLCPQSNILDILCSIFHTTEVQTFFNTKMSFKFLVFFFRWSNDQGIM